MCNMLQLSLHPQGIGKVMASSQKAIMKAVLGDMSFGQKRTQSWTSSRSMGAPRSIPHAVTGTAHRRPCSAN